MTRVKINCYFNLYDIKLSHSYDNEVIKELNKYYSYDKP